MLKPATIVTVCQVAIAIAPGVLQKHLQSMHSQLTVATVDTNDRQDADKEMNRDQVPQWFLAGATTTCIQRAEAIPGRVFHDFDAVTEASPWDVMQKAGENCAVLFRQFLFECWQTKGLHQSHFFLLSWLRRKSPWQLTNALL